MARWITASEVRLALRLIGKQPVLSIAIVVALATGVGLATAEHNHGHCRQTASGAP